MKVFLIPLVCALALVGCSNPQTTTGRNIIDSVEKHRPAIHFTPPAKWMNDPNGMVYHDGVYHLFYQHYPDSTVWGPMHWGHATSTDMIHWKHKPIALYPDSLGYIFSGSAIADINNTSGFGKDGKVPLIAIFTHHHPDGEKSGRSDYQVQSIAYSLDNGDTWTKYAQNPVLKNPGIKDFRDPKVSWHELTKKWIMALATLDRITFYSSTDLKEWAKESDFGKDAGAHGGVWECPDLFPLKYNDEEIWVLLVSINPGGPNGGSATQYFTGRFDGHTFTPFDTATRWIDYGPDNYAGVTWAGTGDRKIFLGWMSNWQYANVVPTQQWRSAMTVPRDLSIDKVNDKYFLRSVPSKELGTLRVEDKTMQNVNAKNLDVTSTIGKMTGPVTLEFSSGDIKDFAVTLSNSAGEKTVIGYDRTANQYYIDRKASGKVDFEKGFASRSVAPRIAGTDTLNIRLVIDNASVEMFADNGLTVMTAIFFPSTDYTDISIQSPEDFNLSSLRFNKLKNAFSNQE